MPNQLLAVDEKKNRKPVEGEPPEHPTPLLADEARPNAPQNPFIVRVPKQHLHNAARQGEGHCGAIQNPSKPDLHPNKPAQMNRAEYLSTAVASGGNGSYPLSTQGLSFIQDQITFLQAFARIGGKRYIPLALRPPADGVVVIDGEVPYFKAAAKPGNGIQTGDNREHRSRRHDLTRGADLPLRRIRADIYKERAGAYTRPPGSR